MRHGPPQQNTLRQHFDVGQNGGAGGGEAAHGFKAGVKVAGNGAGEEKRQGAEQGEQGPSQRDHRKAVAHRDVLP